MPKLYLELTSKFTLDPTDAADEGYVHHSFRAVAEDYADRVFKMLREQPANFLQAKRMRKVSIRARKGSIIEVATVIFELGEQAFPEIATYIALYRGPEYLAEIRRWILMRHMRRESSQRRERRVDPDLMGFMQLPDELDQTKQIEIDAQWLHDRVGEQAKQKDFEVETDEPSYLRLSDSDDADPSYLALESSDPDTEEPGRLILEQGAKKHIKLDVTDNDIVIRFAADPDHFDDQQFYQQNFPGETVTVTYTPQPKGEWEREVRHEVPGESGDNDQQ